MDETKERTAYLTKYALTDGIKKVIAKGPNEYGDYHIDGFYSSFSTRELFFTWPDALADANARRKKKIASLKKQLAKLEALQFVEPEEA